MQSTLANGQLASSATAMLTGSNLDTGTAVRVDVSLYNTGNSSETVDLTVVRGSSTARTVAHAVLATKERLNVTGLMIGPGDTLKGSASDATTVDYDVTRSDGNAFATQSYDANGALKQVNTGISGAQTVSGKQTVKQMSLSPQPADTYSATMTIDVTYSCHVLSVANGTSATVTLTPSAAGSAGDLLTILTAADSSGTVTATFASTFHTTGSSGTTQATTLSKFSSITFQSDGTRWLELCRVTAMG